MSFQTQISFLLEEGAPQGEKQFSLFAVLLVPLGGQFSGQSVLTCWSAEKLVAVQEDWGSVLLVLQPWPFFWASLAVLLALVRLPG